MMLRDNVPHLREFGRELDSCGTKWGEDVDLSGTGFIKAYTGQPSWLETAVDGVIGMHGNEPGSGPSVVIHDIDNSDIHMFWTRGLVGCMCLAILGRDRSGRLDVFFCHARSYEKQDANKELNNPIKLATDFIAAHDHIRVFWGTDFNYQVKDFSGPTKRIDAQQLLSKVLNCWVRDIDCVVHRELVFFPKLAIMKDGNPRKAYNWARSQHLTSRVEFSKSKCLAKFMPDPLILKQSEDHLAGLQEERTAWFRMYLYDSRRTNKITIMEYIIDAYKVGNFDMLRRLARCAANKSSPFRDSDGDNTWHASGASVTASLVLAAYHDAKAKILVMGEYGCGLWPDGSDIYSEREFNELIHTGQPKKIGFD